MADRGYWWYGLANEAEPPTLQSFPLVVADSAFAARRHAALIFQRQSAEDIDPNWVVLRRVPDDELVWCVRHPKGSCGIDVKFKEAEVPKHIKKVNSVVAWCERLIKNPSSVHKGLPECEDCHLRWCMLRKAEAEAMRRRIKG